MDDIALTKHMNAGIRKLVGDALKTSLRKPALALFFARTALWQRRAARRRLASDRRGIHAPAFMIASVTSRCNLNCAGCYARAQHRSPEGEMSTSQLRSLLSQARDVGISIVLLAGGEPLTRPDLLDITREFPDIVFPMFTNGLLISEAVAGRLAAQKNILPVLSLEGHEGDTDGRRGAGVHDRLFETLRNLKRRSVLVGVSLTVTSRNFETVTDESFIRELLGAGAGLVFFVEYVPVKEGTEEWVLTPEQRAGLLRAVNGFRSRLPGLYIAFPGDEEESGGCVAAGRGFVHVSPSGSLEPCPFAPYSDANIKDMPLAEALRSRFLRAIRDNHDSLRETKGGCALWEKREWVKSLLDEAQAGRPGAEPTARPGEAPAPKAAGR